MKSLLRKVLLSSKDEDIVKACFHNCSKDSFGFVRMSKGLYFDADLANIYIGGHFIGRTEWGGNIRENIKHHLTERFPCAPSDKQAD